MLKPNFMWLHWCIHTCERNQTVIEQGAKVALIAADRNNKEVIFKNCALFTDCISETNNTRVDNAKDLAVTIANV